MIRKATILDAEAISILDKEVFGNGLGLDFIVNDMKNNEMAYYFVSENNNVINGYINCWVSENTKILDFCVKEEDRKKGIGKALINEVFKVQKGILSLEVRASNENAIRFYEKLGFIKVVKRRNYYSNKEDAILMIKE